MDLPLNRPGDGDFHRKPAIFSCRAVHFYPIEVEYRKNDLFR
jgi:hypothetical protein